MPNQITTMKVLIVQIPLMVAKPNRPVYGCSEVALFYITGDAEFTSHFMTMTQSMKILRTFVFLVIIIQLLVTDEKPIDDRTKTYFQ